MSTPKLSIVIPIYNAADVIQNLATTILRQPMRDLELILVNDGSTDNSLDIVKKISQTDRRVKIISQKNGGASAARNAGIENARGKFIMFTDADDGVAGDMISKMTTQIENKKNDLVVCGIKFRIVKGREVVSETNTSVAPLPKQNKQESFTKYVIRLLGIDARLYNPSNKIFRRDIIDKYKIRFQTNLDFGEDLTFNLHYLKHVDKISFINEPLYIYNFDAENGTFGKSSLVYENRLKNFQELLEFAGKNRDAEMNDLLNWVKFYWFYAYISSVSTAKLSVRRRLKLLKRGAKLENLKPSKSGEFIGRKKFFLERVIKFASLSPVILFGFARATNFLKTSRLMSKLWQKLKVSSMS